MGNGCSNTDGVIQHTPVKAAFDAQYGVQKKKRSLVGNAVHNVKKKINPKKKWDDSQPEKAQVRKNHLELNDYLDAQKPRPKDRDKPEPRQRKENKNYRNADGVPDNYKPEYAVDNDDVDAGPFGREPYALGVTGEVAHVAVAGAIGI